jgi:hypothetical protein
MMSHLLSTINYNENVPKRDVKLPDQPVHSGTYQRPARKQFRYVDDFAAKLLGDPEKDA